MARIVPADIARLELAGARYPELQTLRVLQARLPDSYTVFHGVHWTREFPRDTVFGEIDFVVVNRAGRVLLIEQKSGALEETPEGLVARYPDGPKNVAHQVHRALDHVREKFKRTRAGGARLELDYLIYCPAHRLQGINAAGLDASRVVDATARDRLAERIGQCLEPGDPGPGRRAETVLAFFRQSFDLVPDIHAHVTSQEREFTRLSGGLVRVLEGLEMTPLRLRVGGTAGCGKTLIARHVFDAAIARGRRPLLVCFNRPLAERLKVAVRPGGLVTTWNGLCSRFLAEQGHRLAFEDMKRDPEFWRRVAELILGEPIPDAWTFDALVVDEGQDFAQGDFEILRLFLRDGADILWLEDPDQNVREQPPVRLEDFVGFRVRDNYRTPQTIARFIQRTLGIEFDARNSLPGLGVGVTGYAEAADQPGLVAKIITDLQRRGFSHGQIVILTTRHTVTPGTARSAFDGLERVGTYRLRRFTGEYDLFGNQVMTPGQIAFDSIARFKGQEAPAVILVDVDPAPGEDARTEKLLFAGMTRATVRLEVLARAGHPFTARLVRAGGSPVPAATG